MYSETVNFVLFVLFIVFATVHIRCCKAYGERFEHHDRNGFVANMSFYAHYLAAICFFMSIPFSLKSVIISFILLVAVDATGDYFFEKSSLEDQERPEQSTTGS